MPFTKDQIKEANKHSILDFLDESFSPEENKKQRNDGSVAYSAFCPIHEHDSDGKKSLFIVNRADGSSWAKCYDSDCEWKGGTVDFVMAVEQLKFPQALEKILGVSSNPDWKKEKASERGTLVTVYDYYGTNGKIAYRVARYASPKTFRPQHRDENNDWADGYGDEERIPYRLPEIAEAAEVFLVEGEKDADRLCAEGEHASTWPGGASSWRDSYARYFAGKTVIIVPDNDEPGFTAARKASLALLPVTEKLGWVDVGGYKNSKDVSEYLDNGGNLTDLMAHVKWGEVVPTWQEVNAENGESASNDSVSDEVPL